MFETVSRNLSFVKAIFVIWKTCSNLCFSASHVWVELVFGSASRFGLRDNLSTVCVLCIEAELLFCASVTTKLLNFVRTQPITTIGATESVE